MVNDLISMFKWLNKKPLYEWIISWILLSVFVIIIIFIELAQWILIVRMLLNLFGLDYLEYAYLMPFEYIYEGENLSFIVLIAAIILTALIVIFLGGNQDVKVTIFLFEILAIGVAIYIKVWVIAIAYMMKFAGLRFGKWTMVMAFIFAVIIHGLFLILRKIAISIRQ